MNKNNQILFNVLLFAFIGITGYGQEKAKTYKETFNVGDETVLNIDTSHADIEFETWDKNVVEITAVVELEGATEEESKAFFEKDVVQILGNSKEIKVRTKGTGFGVLAPNAFQFEDFQVVVPDVSMVEPLFEDIEIPELPEVMVLPELPPIPPIPFTEFDYDAYKKDGDAYLKKWKKEFDKNFDKNYQAKLEKWGDRMEKLAKEREDRRREFVEQRAEIREQSRAVRDQARAARNQAREEMREHRNELRESRSATRSFSIHSDDDSNIFYFSSDDGENKKYKVKKSIKVKMPKSVKLKMNVRHGEVKLAANTRNINASLSYASLLASTIDGDRTNIRASYSPVVVQKWNYGQLKTDYSDRVDLKEVKQLRLNSVSSNVTIDRLMDKVFVTNNLGDVQIKSIADGFSSIDITVENGEVDCTLPDVSFNIYVNETASEFEFPEKLAIDSSKNYGTTVHKGYFISNKSDRSININSKYSEVVLKE